MNSIFLGFAPISANVKAFWAAFNGHNKYDKFLAGFTCGYCKKTNCEDYHDFYGNFKSFLLI